MATLVVAMSFTACSKSELDNMSITEAASVIPGTYKVNFYGDTYGDAGPLVNLPSSFSAMELCLQPALIKPSQVFG